MTGDVLMPPAACVRETGTAKGKGVFALRAYAAGEVVEVAPVLVLKTDFEQLPRLLKTYVFDWTSLTGLPRTQAIALGWGSLYNHANPATLRYEPQPRWSRMRYIAARDIAAGEELTINYNAEGGAAQWDDDNWFDRHDITLIEEPQAEPPAQAARAPRAPAATAAAAPRTGPRRRAHRQERAR